MSWNQEVRPSPHQGAPRLQECLRSSRWGFADKNLVWGTHEKTLWKRRSSLQVSSSNIASVQWIELFLYLSIPINDRTEILIYRQEQIFG